MRFRDRVKEFRRVKGSELLPNPKNWRKHPKKQRAAMEALLRDVGFAGAALARTTPDGIQLIDGHLRAEIMPDQEIPVLITDLNDAEAAEVLATYDPIAAIAEADREKLDAVLREVQSGDAEIQELIADIAKEVGLYQSTETKEDSIPETIIPAAQAGDVWALGSHRLMCGDCIVSDNVRSLMGEERAILMATDPPYGVAYTDDARVAAERAHGRQQRMPKWGEGIENDENTEGEDLQPFLESAFHAAVDCALLPNAAWYLWHAQLTQGFFAAAAAAAANLVLHRQIIWVKPSLLFGFGDYHWRHELCFYGWVKGNRPPFLGPRNQTTIWEIKHEESNANRDHPTQKPLEIFAIPMRNHTVPGELCYEPFAGSGSQLIAAEQLGRRCYAMEISRKYCDVIIARWEQLTGSKAELIDRLESATV